MTPKKIHQINQLILKVAQRCNLNCKYCYMYEHADKSYLRRPAFMSDEIFDLVLTRALDYCEARPGASMKLLFHGGEPMLIGPERFNRFAERASARLGVCLAGIEMQTNATLVDTEWLRLFKKYKVAVGVSFDGLPAIHNMFRIDHTNTGSHGQVLAGLQKLVTSGSLSGVLAVVNPYHCGTGVYEYFRSLGLTRFDFLLPDVTHDSKHIMYPALSRNPVANYLIPIFDAWMAEDDPLITIRFFRNIIKFILGLKSGTEATGNLRPGYVVVDSDGAIQVSDALRISYEGSPETALNIQSHSLEDLDKSSSLAFAVLHQGVSLCKTCDECSERDVCGGGFFPTRYSTENGFDNPSVWCADLYEIIKHVRARMEHSGFRLPLQRATASSVYSIDTKLLDCEIHSN